MSMKMWIQLQLMLNFQMMNNKILEGTAEEWSDAAAVKQEEILYPLASFSDEVIGTDSLEIFSLFFKDELADIITFLYKLLC